MTDEFSIQEHEGSFWDLLPEDDVLWAYCVDGRREATSVPPDIRDHHLFCRDSEGTLHGVLTFSPDGMCDLRWMRSRTSGVGRRLFDAFLQQCGDAVITCHVEARGEDRDKVLHMLRDSEFQQEGTSDDWTRYPRSNSYKAPGCQ